MPHADPPQAWIAGAPAPLQQALEEAARLLGASRLPVLAGLGADVAAARAAVALARRLGGVVDHMHSDALLTHAEVLRAGGMLFTTPTEARLRGDLILLVGAGLLQAWPALPERLLAPPPAPDGPRSRRVIALGAAADEMSTLGAHGAVATSVGSLEAAALLGALRAQVAGRPVRLPHEPAAALARLAAALTAARFGVAVWSTLALPALAAEMLCGLVADLNAGTRFTTLPLQPGDNAGGVNQACGWLTGFPVRTGFGRGRPEHDPWRFEARRLLESGESDCAVWISTYTDAAPPWRTDVTSVVLARGGARFAPAPRVQFAVGRPGLDHDGVQHCAAAGTLAAAPASASGAAAPAAEILARIASRLPGPVPC